MRERIYTQEELDKMLKDIINDDNPKAFVKHPFVNRFNGKANHRERRKQKRLK